MELKQIKELMTAMGRTGTKKLILKKGGFELHLERDGQTYQAMEKLEGEESPLQPDIFYRRAGQALPRNESLTSAINPPPEPSKTESIGTFITSPMVGTYYASPSPEDPAFVKPGDTVTKDTVVCIIEAMKVMNEIKAGSPGVIAEVLVESGNPVEFGTKLFRIQ